MNRENEDKCGRKEEGWGRAEEEVEMLQKFEAQLPDSRPLEMANNKVAS